MRYLDIYVVNAKTAAQWAVDLTLADVTTGGAQTVSLGGTTIQNNTFQVTVGSELSANAGLGLGVGYDVVLDVDQDGTLSDGDFIDGLGDEAGFYAVHDTTAGGPLPVTELNYNLSASVGTTFGIPSFRLAENLFYPTGIATMGQLPLIVIGHGHGHLYDGYDHIGNHLASYGYIVMSHDNDTGAGPEGAALTTLGHTDAFIDQVAAGATLIADLTGHLDSSRITWIGHSRGAEGVAIAYDRLFDGNSTPANFNKADIRLISSMLPTDFNGTDIANPHDANFHLWTAAGDDDVDGSAGDECGNLELCRPFTSLSGAQATGSPRSSKVRGTAGSTTVLRWAMPLSVPRAQLVRGEL